ncbi:pentapeptide repeat-containing protein [Candidatus Poribacteria bacterium]|nr:pentapeptide repeat-containing protein [Candidatus Poribacteria bacterium]
MRSSDQLKMLMDGVEAWNRWRRANPRVVPNLSAADCHGLDLRGVQLAETDLTHTDLSEADLSGANLVRATLDRANVSCANATTATFVGASLNNALCYRTKLTGADLSRVLASGTSFILADLGGATLTEANLHDADLTESSMEGAVGDNVVLRGAKLIGANLRGARLRNGDLVFAVAPYANFAESDLSACRLEHAVLDHAVLDGARVHGTVALDAHMRRLSANQLIVSPSGEPDVAVDSFDASRYLQLVLDSPLMAHVSHPMLGRCALVAGIRCDWARTVGRTICQALRLEGWSPVSVTIDPAQAELSVAHAQAVVRLAGIAFIVDADGELAHQVLEPVRWGSMPVMSVAQLRTDARRRRRGSLTIDEDVCVEAVIEMLRSRIRQELASGI